MYVMYNFFTMGRPFHEYKMGRACSTYGANRKAYKVFVGKPEGKRSLGS
jgi:hypothetical protein